YKHHCWKLIHNGIVLMECRYNEPSLPVPSYNGTALEEALNRQFPNMSGERHGYFHKLVATASNAKHGTMLVISAQADAEAKRLSSVSFPVKRLLLTQVQLLSVSSIDGAILLDQDGDCHSLGVILDGQASSGERSDRGARYNSAVRYTNSQKN